MDTRLLTFGDPEAIEQRVRQLAAAAQNYPGFVFKAVGDLPHNIPLQNIRTYFESLRRHGRR